MIILGHAKRWYSGSSEPRLITPEDFHSLLSMYERSVCKSLRNINREKYSYTNSTQPNILASRMPPGDMVVSILSYPWISEMQCRWNTINFLIEHELTEMLDHTNSWPTLNIPKKGLLKRLVMFKKAALLLLYRLTDCAVSVVFLKSLGKLLTDCF